MKTYSYKDAPLKIYGLPCFEKNAKLERLPEEVRKAVPTLEFLGRRPVGARICFKTNSKNIKLKMELETLSVDKGMSIFACQSVNVMVGERTKARFIGLLSPEDYENKMVEKTFKKSEAMEDVTLWLPRNEVISDFTISIDDDAEILEPTPYKYPPMLYYGSSITEGGCAARATNAYNAIISQHLDVDYYNLGFSGSARGEREIAEFISEIPMSIFVMDYDHNAYEPGHLEKTHEPFFKIIREKNPDLPIIMMSRPDFDKYNDFQKNQREVIRTTYNNAISAGDKNVYFIDGETFFGQADKEFCTCDGIHPNDLGFHKMAAVLEPLVKEILENLYGK